MANLPFPRTQADLWGPMIAAGLPAAKYLYNAWRTPGGSRRRRPREVGAPYSPRARFLAKGSSRGGRTGRNNREGGFIGLEKKFVDESEAVAVVQNDNMLGLEVDPSPANCIGSTAQGDGESSRDGIKYTIVMIYVKGTVIVFDQTGQSTLDDSPECFVALVQDKNSNGAQGASEQVFTNPSTVNYLCTRPLRNIQYAHRYTVHDSVHMTFGQRAVTGVPPNILVEGISRPFALTMKRRVPVHCTGTTNGIANIEDNSFHLIACKNHTSSNMTISYNARTRFYAR